MPPSMLDPGQGMETAARHTMPQSGYAYSAANMPAAPYSPKLPKGQRWRLRTAVPTLPSMPALLAALGITRKRSGYADGPATREELSRLFERELTDFARARPKRRR
ncbi:hypothetical protein [Pseudoruegeria sp. SHC-113]|uniref:hypothetical protein n=1 Tax=Pseudoruegeria sp. SHC-113 TaxID=2855439 RepID=UPI0021BAC4CC|nr:hypothetical protein [Pseudoruegeria sp. SHC-113]MCT8158763.1 hypothetical protein [Pseudoruegeria sp. SHC-113]